MVVLIFFVYFLISKRTRPDIRHKMRLVCVLFTFENNTGPSDGPTDLRTNGHALSILDNVVHSWLVNNCSMSIPGKSAITNGYMLNLPKEQYLPNTINFSARTSANQVSTFETRSRISGRSVRPLRDPLKRHNQYLQHALVTVLCFPFFFNTQNQS